MLTRLNKKKMLKQQKKVEAEARAGRKTAQLVEEKEDDENIELYKYVISCSSGIRKQSLSLRNYTYMDDYFVPDRKKE